MVLIFQKSQKILFDLENQIIKKNKIIKSFLSFCIINGLFQV